MLILNRTFSLKRVWVTFIFMILAVNQSFANEANLILPDLTLVSFFCNTITANVLLEFVFFICIF